MKKFTKYIVKKYIIFHDTETFGVNGQQPNVDFGYEEEADYFVKAIDKTPFDYFII